MKIVRVWMLLVVVMGVTLGGCETGESLRVNDVAPPSGVEVVKPPALPSETVARKPSAQSSPRASMDRLMREMEGKSPLPEESGVAVRHPEDRTQPHASASGSTGTCPPAWFKREKIAKFDGMGESAEIRESAEQRARLDVAKNIELAISGEDTSQVREATGQGFEYSVGSTIVERVNLSLTGLSITKVDTCGNQWYALAALDLAKASTAWREDLRRLDDEAKAFFRHVNTHKQNNAVFAELLAWYRLAVVRETASQIERRLPYLTGKAESGPLRAGAAQDAKQHYENLLRSLEVKIVSGDNQQAVEQAALPEPFVVQMLAGDDLVAGVPVYFTLTQGTIDVPPKAMTDKAGKVSVRGHYSQSTKDDAPARIDVNVRLDQMITQMTNEDLSAFKQAVEQKQNSLTVRFRVQPPVFHLRKEALGVVGDAEKWSAAIRDRRAKGDILGVMKAMAELYRVQNMGKPVVGRLLRLHPDSGKDVDALGAPKETRDALESVLRSLEVKIVSGDNQQAVEQAALPEPFVVQVLAGKDPVAGVPVAFTVQEGTITVPSSREITDKDGKVEAEGRYPTPLENDDAARIEAKVSLDEITKNYPDALKQVVEPKQKRLAVDFHVKPPVFHLLDEARGIVGKAKKWKSEIQAHGTKRDVLGVMKAMAELYKVQNMGRPVVERLLRLHPDSGKDVDALGAPEETHHKLERLVSSFQFTLVNGDQQRAELDRPLNKALEAQLVAKLEEKDVPVSNVPVQFTFDQDRGTVEPRSVLTDEEGYVRAGVRRVDPGDGNDENTFITASPDGTGLGRWLPESLRTRFITDLKEKELRFRITRPRGCVSADPFRGPLYKLACDLVKDANESVGKFTVVRDFVERTSGDRHPLSDRIEEALKAGLTLSKQVRVLEPSTSENTLIPHDPDVEVSGLYEADAQGKSLRVDAKLSRLTNHGKEAETVAEATIPLNDLPGTGQSDLPSSAHDLPVVPDPSGFATHDEWVETFWTHRNPRAAFRTEMQSEKEFYQEGDHPTFLFRTDRDCYLWVFAVDVKGNGGVLLPNFYRQKPPLIRARGRVSIPNPAEFSITIHPPFGSERVKTVCTTRPIDVVASQHVYALTAQSPLFGFSRENQRFRLVGGASLAGVTLDPGEWSEAHTTVITVPKGQTMTRGMRGLQDLGLVSTKE